MKIYAVYGPGLIDKIPYRNMHHIYRCMDSIPDIKSLVLGGGKGIDVAVEKWADEHNIPHQTVRPMQGVMRDIGPAGTFTLRDAEMLSLADGCIIFSNPGMPYVGIMSAAIAAHKNILVFHA